MRLRQKYLEWRDKHSKKIYILCLWGKYCVQEVSLYRFKKGEPQVILWTDHNGFQEEYYVGSWREYSTGAISWFNTRETAELAKNIRERLEKSK